MVRSSRRRPASWRWPIPGGLRRRLRSFGIARRRAVPEDRSPDPVCPDRPSYDHSAGEGMSVRTLSPAQTTGTAGVVHQAVVDRRSWSDAAEQAQAVGNDQRLPGSRVRSWAAARLGGPGAAPPRVGAGCGRDLPGASAGGRRTPCGPGAAGPGPAAGPARCLASSLRSRRRATAVAGPRRRTVQGIRRSDLRAGCLLEQT